MISVIAAIVSTIAAAASVAYSFKAWADVRYFEAITREINEKINERNERASKRPIFVSFDDPDNRD